MQENPPAIIGPRPFETVPKVATNGLKVLNMTVSRTV
jgi:hypothetical protein